MIPPTPKILDLTIINHYADGQPIYRFHTSFPSRNVRTTGPVDAHAYEAADIYGNMAEVLGVTRTDSGLYRGVINTFHSNT